MEQAIEIVKARIKYLEELAGVIPEHKGFTVLARLAETKEILRLISVLP